MLEQQRSEILGRILHLGDFRSGSISSITGRCGKPDCRCHKPGQPGHGPNYRLTRKVNGKTVSETFASPAELRKAQREVEAFHRFRELSQELLEVNEKICRVRPVGESLTEAEKKNGRRGPAGGGAGNSRAVGSHLHWPAQERPMRLGSGRNGDPRRKPSPRRESVGASAECTRPVRTHHAVWLRPPGALPPD